VVSTSVNFLDANDRPPPELLPGLPESLLVESLASALLRFDSPLDELSSLLANERTVLFNWLG